MYPPPPQALAVRRAIAGAAPHHDAAIGPRVAEVALALAAGAAAVAGAGIREAARLKALRIECAPFRTLVAVWSCILGIASATAVAFALSMPRASFEA